MSKKCPHCKKGFLTFDEEKLHGACIHCLYGLELPKGKIKDPDLFVPLDEEFVVEVPKVKAHDVVQRLVIPAKKYAQMQAYCKLATGEISGLGEVKVVDGVATLVALALLPQENTGMSTDISEESLHKFTLAMARRGKSLQNWNVWWHTHYNFATFWSQTDEDTIRKLARFFGSYVISVVTNQAGSTLCRLDEKRSMYELELNIESYRGYNKLTEQCRREIKRKVVNKPFVTRFQHAFRGLAYVYD